MSKPGIDTVWWWERLLSPQKAQGMHLRASKSIAAQPHQRKASLNQLDSAKQLYDNTANYTARI